MSSSRRPASTIARIFALDMRSLAVLRIGIAVAILVDLIDRARFLRAHYTDAGILSRAALARVQAESAWSLHLMAGDVDGQALLFVIAGAFALALLAGWHTRAVAVVSFILLASLQARTPPVAYGADGVLRALLFFACFLPIGARFSVDALFAPRKPDTHVSVAGAALTVQVAAIYFFTGIQKLGDESWRALNAVFYAVSVEHHATGIGTWLAQHTSLTRALTLFTLLLEIVLPLLLFVPLGRARLRVFLVAIFSVFHIGTALCLHLGLFPWVSILAWLTFLPGDAWRVLEKRAPITMERAGVDVDRSRAAAALALTGLVVALWFSLSNASPSLPVPRIITHLGRATMLDQRWNMFIKPMHDGFFVAPGLRADGTEVDVLKRGEPVSWEPPEGAVEFPSMRWRKVMTDMTFQRASSLRSRRNFLRYLCNTWNAGADDDERLLKVELVFVQHDDRPDGPSTKPFRRTLASRACAQPRARADDSAPYFEMRPPPSADAGVPELDSDDDDADDDDSDAVDAGPDEREP